MNSPSTSVGFPSLSPGGYSFAERPFLVFWEVTRACALACRHCRAEAQPKRHPDELDEREARDLVDRLGELAPPMLILTGGDPLMRTDVLALARRGVERWMRVGLSPSATARLAKFDFGAIRQSGIDRISLSLDGATRETHDEFRGLAGTFDRTLDAVERAREAGLSVQINTTLTAANLPEFPAFRDLMFRLRPSMWSVFVLVPTGRAGVEEIPSGEQLEEVFGELAELVGRAPFAVKTTEGHHFRRVLAQRGLAGIRHSGNGSRGNVGMRSPLGIRDGRGILFVSHTGVVSPSGFLPIDCGNVRTRHPAEIYREHPLFVSLRDSDALGGKCGRCEFRSICGGSRARAYGLTGDPFAADPSCVYEPLAA